MYRFAICDDRREDVEYIEGLIREWNREAGHQIRIDRFFSGEAFLFAFEEDQGFDVLLLDIEMGDLSGIDLAQRLRQLGTGIQIVFVTGYMEYIAQGYDVEALHYLLKPVTAKKLCGVLDRAMERLKDRERELTLTVPEGIVRIPLAKIRYLEVMGNYVTVHGEKSYSVKRTLGQMEELLDERFYRIHRSYIVNLQFVKKCTRTEVVLKDDVSLPLSRKRYDGLNRAIIMYF
ncbi:MAG: LytTR family DNA-binding domain-containing protein [Lachnospiraceae bacterium]|nr:LytTR family DNA-binding domain-containing protein [Muribaculaceae bacterium]MCM1409755.1 LytTR family DNA-binding domain-containing protein [Lachnospiraceae bacterium]